MLINSSGFLRGSSTVSFISTTCSSNPPICSYATSGFSSTSIPVTIGSFSDGRTCTILNVCWLRATRTPGSRDFSSKNREYPITKLGPVLLFTTTLPSSKTSVTVAITSGGDLNLSISPLRDFTSLSSLIFSFSIRTLSFSSFLTFHMRLRLVLVLSSFRIFISVLRSSIFFNTFGDMFSMILAHS